MKISNLKIGEAYEHRFIIEMFKVASSGGIRFSTKTNAIVIISNARSNTKTPYQDSWNGNTLIYTGQGKYGDQKLTLNNDKLAKSNKNRTPIYIFESFQPNEYIYRGIAYLSKAPYIISEPDSQNNYRSVYKFPLTLIDDTFLIPESILEQTNEEITGKFDKLTEADIAKKAKEAGEHDHTLNFIYVTINKYTRSPFINKYIKNLAKGKCALCKLDAPFTDKNNEPFLHVHHIKYLANGGIDTPKNCVAVCPNCHAKIHNLESDEDKQILLNVVKNRKE